MKTPHFVPSVPVSPDDVMEHAQTAIRAACVYFEISSEWEIELKPSAFDDGTEAQITHSGRYLTALIEVNMPHFQQYPERIWSKVGHEVAHLVTAELAYVWQWVPNEVSEPLTDQHKMALERATVRMERMFARDCPDPWVS